MLTESEEKTFQYLLNKQCDFAEYLEFKKLKQKRIATPAESRYGKDVKPDKVKPLAQYLAEYVEHESEIECVEIISGLVSWQELLEQALDAYQSTENVVIKVEGV